MSTDSFFLCGQSHLILHYCILSVCEAGKNIKTIYCCNIVGDIDTEVLNTIIEYRRFS